MLEVTGISKSFAGRKVLEDITFSAFRGEVCGLVGYNGVGKTTLMKILSGIYRPDCGAVTADGQRVYENPAVKRRLFFMTEEAPFFSGWSMERMRRFYKGFYPDWQDAVFERLTDFFDLDPQAQIASFSKGMQRQAGITIAFSAGADILLLDEAFDGLDEVMRTSLSEMIRCYTEKRQAVLVVSSHNLRELEYLADRIVLLDSGKLMFHDAVSKMRAQYQSCSFTLPEGMGLPEYLCDFLIEKKENRYRLVIRSEETDLSEQLEQIKAEAMEIRPVSLEEFFRRGRLKKTVKWEEVFPSVFK